MGTSRHRPKPKGDAQGFFLVAEEAQDPSDPTGRKLVLVRVEVTTMSRLAIAAEAKTFDVRTAKEILEHPHQVWRGIRPARECEWGWCYVGRTSTAHDRRGNTFSLGEDWLFVAFLSPRFTLLEWGRERPSEDDPDLPATCQIRFGELVWPKR